MPVHWSEPGEGVTVPVDVLSGTAENVLPSVSVSVKVTGTTVAAPRSAVSFVWLIRAAVASW